ncbi:MAG: hypothetical protein J0I41_08445 [Filimonas sp.]|nr:hypothetical protein [Filimonas sp.]
MENVIIIVQQKKNKNKTQVEDEAKKVFDMMALIDSFPAFLQSYDVMDMNHSCMIKKEKQLLKRYLAVTPAAFEFIIGKN